MDRVPQRVSSVLIRSAIGIPFRESDSKIEWTAEIPPSVTAPQWPRGSAQRWHRLMHTSTKASAPTHLEVRAAAVRGKCTPDDPERPDVDGNRQQEQQRDADAFTDMRA